MSKIKLFIDTNCFLHMTDVGKCAWWTVEKLKAFKRIDIMVAKVVIDELDEKKNHGNEKLQRRARLALKLIEQASENDELALSLRTNPVEVRLCVTSKAIDWSTKPGLSRDSPDDRLVAEALDHGKGVIVFSNDTGPRIRARVHKVEALAPPDKWLLPAEQTGDQKKIKSLERELEIARSTKPKIILSFDGEGERKNELTFRVPVLEPLGETRARRLTSAYLSRNPRNGGVIKNQFPGITSLNLTRDMAGERYDREYDTFEENVFKYFENLHARLFRFAHVMSVPYTILNDSSVTAQGLRVDVQVEGGYLVAERREVVGSLKAPKAPVRRELYLDFIDRVPNIPAQLNRTVDPVAFTWVAAPKPLGTTGASQCLQFHAKRSVDLHELVWVREALPASGRVHFAIGASNLAEPVNGVAVFKLVEEKVDWSTDWVLGLLPKGVMN